MFRTNSAPRFCVLWASIWDRSYVFRLHSSCTPVSCWRPRISIHRERQLPAIFYTVLYTIWLVIAENHILVGIRYCKTDMIGNCHITLEQAGPTHILIEVMLKPNDIREMIANIFQQCIEGYGGYGGKQLDELGCLLRLT